MSNSGASTGPLRPAGIQMPMDKNKVGGSAGVEIIGFPQVLHTRVFGDPETLFVPLLDAARDAFQMVERLSGHGEGRAQAVNMSAMHLASALLRDSNFALVAKGLSHENVYTIDLDAGTLHVQTRLYAVVSRRTSFFKVEIAGKVTSGPFVVRNPGQGSVILQVEEKWVREPNYFTSTLPQECLRVQMDQERFGRLDEAQGSDTTGEVRLFVFAGGLKIPVALRQKEAMGKWDIIDGRRQEWVGNLTPEAEEHLKGLMNELIELFNAK